MTRRPLDGLNDVATHDAFEAKKIPADCEDLPLHRVAQLGAEGITGDGHDRIWKPRKRETSEGGPHERGGWENVRIKWKWCVATESPMRIAVAPIPTESAGEKEVHTCTVGRGDTYHTVAARDDLAVFELPFKGDVSVAARELVCRQRRTRAHDAFERMHTRRARGGTEHQRRAEECQATTDHWMVIDEITSSCTSWSSTAFPETTRAKAG